MKLKDQMISANKAAHLIRTVISVFFCAAITANGIALIIFGVSMLTDNFLPVAVTNIFYFVLPYFYVSITFIVSAAFMIKILRSIENREPFHIYNSKRLRLIGITMMIGSFFKPVFLGIIMLGESHYMQMDSFPNQLQIYNNLVIDVSLLFGGLLVLALSYVFTYGARLQREHDQTV